MMIRTEKVNDIIGTIEQMEEGFSAGCYKVSIRHGKKVTYYAVFRDLDRAEQNYETMIHFTKKGMMN